MKDRASGSRGSRRRGARAGSWLEDQVRAAGHRLRDLRRRAGRGGARRVLLTPALRDLALSLDELHVAAREIREQNERLAAERLRVVAERQRYLQLFEFAPDALIVTDRMGSIQRANRSAGALLGVSPRFLAGKPLGLYLGRSRENVFSNLLNAVGDGASLRQREIDLRPRGAAPDRVEVSVAPVPEAAGAGRDLLWLLHDVSERRRLEDELRRLSSRLMTAQDEERRRIALDLHDSMGQNLAALQFQVEIVERSSTRLDGSLRGHLAKCVRLVRDCVATVRTLSDLLHPPMLDDVGLVATLQWYASRFESRTGVRVEFDSTLGPGRLPAPVEIALFRVTQESLTNIWRHAGASVARIVLAARGDRVTLEVTDNGRGIAATARRRSSPEAPGVGIIGMRERLARLGGDLSIETSPRGTRVRAAVATNGGASPEAAPTPPLAAASGFVTARQE